MEIPRGAAGEVKPLVVLREVCFWHFSDIHAAQFNVRVYTLFGHQGMSRARRRVTHGGHPASVAHDNAEVD